MLIQESQTLEDVVWSVCENAIRHLGYEDCVIYLLDEDNPSYLYQAAALGNKNPDKRIILGPIKIKIGEGIVGSVALSGRSELVSDTSKDKRYLTDDILRLSEITVPIINNNKVIGVIDSEHSQKYFFPENHLKILNTISAMTATKIVQVKYNEELINHKNRLEETVEKRTNDLIEVEKLAVLGRLSAGVAHEMNTPLGAIASSSDNLTGILRELFADGMENANHNTVIEACKLADDLMISDPLTSREERKERKLLAEHLKYKYKVGLAASNHATSLVECGILTKHKDVLDHIYQSEDIEEALELTLVIIRIRKSIDTIGLASQKAAKVVRALKSYVHNDNTSGVEVFDARRSVHDVLLLFTNQLKQNVELHIDMESELLLQGNESELSKVWSNLIANALYAMQNSGNLWVKGASDKQNIILTFANDGPAIPEEVQARLFEPFYTTKPVGDGSGMGLSIAFNVVASMNGSIEVETGETTTFTVTIPKING
jgi:signal transduction histidine kinase